MNSKSILKLDWCSHEAAKYAVEHWHYSRKMPPGKTVKIGVWEERQFVGAVIFGQGSSLWLAHQYHIPRIQVVELVRVAITDHRSPISRIVAIALRMLRKSQRGIRLVVSFADQNEGHYGGIYQAGGWEYTGVSQSTPKWIDRRNGRVVHDRERNAIVGGVLQWGRRMKKREASEFERIDMKPKYRYVMPLDAEMRDKIEPLRKPYPKRVRSGDSDTSAIHAEEGGAIPTRTLCSNQKEA